MDIMDRNFTYLNLQLDIPWRSQKVEHAKSVAYHWNHILSVLSSGYWLWVQNSYPVVWCRYQDTKGCQKYPSIDSVKFIHAVLKGGKWISMFKLSNTLQDSKGVHGILEKEHTVESLKYAGTNFRGLSIFSRFAGT